MASVLPVQPSLFSYWPCCSLFFYSRLAEGKNARHNIWKAVVLTQCLNIDTWDSAIFHLIIYSCGFHCGTCSNVFLYNKKSHASQPMPKHRCISVYQLYIAVHINHNHVTMCPCMWPLLLTFDSSDPYSLPGSMSSQHSNLGREFETKHVNSVTTTAIKGRGSLFH